MTDLVKKNQDLLEKRKDKIKALDLNQSKN